MMSEDKKKELRCSFCGKSEREVHRMIQDGRTLMRDAPTSIH